jgi:hypothetical protein
MLVAAALLFSKPRRSRVYKAFLLLPALLLSIEIILGARAFRQGLVYPNADEARTITALLQNKAQPTDRFFVFGVPNWWEFPRQGRHEFTFFPTGLPGMFQKHALRSFHVNAFGRPVEKGSSLDFLPIPFQPPEPISISVNILQIERLYGFVFELPKAENTVPTHHHPHLGQILKLNDQLYYTTTLGYLVEWGPQWFYNPTLGFMKPTPSSDEKSLAISTEKLGNFLMPNHGDTSWVWSSELENWVMLKDIPEILGNGSKQ